MTWNAGSNFLADTLNKEGKLKITPEVIEALRTLREVTRTDMAVIEVVAAFSTLDDAGVFAEIDEATGYDVVPAPEPVSKCTCPDTDYRKTTGNHHTSCPGDPAEWGDSAYVAQFSRVTDVSGKPWESK